MPVDTTGRPPTGPVRRAERALAPDLARGAMLLIIALANSAGVAFAGEPGFNNAPQGGESALTFGLFELAHARGYPVFALMFGYGIVQLARRQDASGSSPRQVRALLVRRGAWLTVLGFAHALLLYYGDFLGAYGIVCIAMTWLLLRRGDRFHRIVLVIWALSLVELLVVGGMVVRGLLTGTGHAPLPVGHVGSLAASSYADSLADRLAEWPGHTLTTLPFVLIAWLGMWAARRRILERPGRHRALLVRTAVVGIGIAVVGGLPAALIGAGWLHADEPTAHMALLLHGGGGMFAGPGYVAVFGLVAARVTRPGAVVVRALVALGRRSLSGYLFQSVAWLVLLLPFTLDLAGQHTSPTAVVLVIALAVWLATVLIALRLDDRDLPGPAETVLRRLTYGPGARRRPRRAAPSAIS
ncbi:DUF418 domain-containing protein [Streptomyces sp. NPDC016309]|uniref:DUF418 domain-containing protein n=1 Tax=Streptomyces sp. NPDC016309 TaxID=3364965 RepID=UPI00370348C6